MDLPPPAPAPAASEGAADDEPWWLLPLVLVLVAAAAGAATGCRSWVAVGGGLLAVGIFRETLRFFERVDAVASSGSGPPPGPGDPTDQVPPVTA